MHANGILDLVNADDEVIGTIDRSQHDDTIKNPTQFIRSADMFLVNSTGKLWIPKRTAHKKIFPNGLDFSCGGHVDSGGTYEQAMLREIHEELNLVLQPGDLRFIDKVRDDEIGYFRAIYTFNTDETPEYNPDDFVSAEWLTPQEIFATLDGGVVAKKTLRQTVELLQAHGY